jgi:ABC-2 type transport system permease protein
MSVTSEIQRVNSVGWIQGFSNLWKKENQRWWQTKRWWSTIVVWLLIVNGVLAILLFVVPNQIDAANIDAAAEVMGPPHEKAAKEIVNLGLVTFISILGTAPAVGAIIVGQETILTEKHTGTAAWVMSKPASRTAFLLSKFAANAFALLITVTIIQGAIAYGQFWMVLGSPLPIVSYLNTMGISFLALLFYLAFALMLGTLFSGRGPVLGMSLVLLLGYSIFVELFPILGRIMPWNLTAALGPTKPALALYPMMQQPITDFLPLISTVGFTVAFLAIALWRFHKEEF